MIMPADQSCALDGDRSIAERGAFRAASNDSNMLRQGCLLFCCSIFGIAKHLVEFYSGKIAAAENNRRDFTRVANIN